MVNFTLDVCIQQIRKHSMGLVYLPTFSWNLWYILQYTTGKYTILGIGFWNPWDACWSCCQEVRSLVNSKASLVGIPSLATIAITIPYFKMSQFGEVPYHFLWSTWTSRFTSPSLSRTEQKTASPPLHSVCRPTSCKDSSTSRGCSSKALRNVGHSAAMWFRGEKRWGPGDDFPGNHWESSPEIAGLMVSLHKAGYWTLISGGGTLGGG